jgi:hypothetical protein
VAWIAMFPASRKKVRESCSFWRAEPDLSRNVRMSECPSFMGRKGFRLLLPICIWIGYSIVWESGYFQLGTRISYFFCWNIPVPEKPFANAKAVIFVQDIPVTKVSYF